MNALTPFHLHHYTPVSEQRDATVIRRIRTVIDSVELDCECRARLNEALGRFNALEQQRAMRQQLVLARQHRERIKAILDFLQEVDDLMISETDRSVYVELALLFEEVAAIAVEGAAAMHSLADHPARDEA